jgi:putative N-acetylmannosamine-6-phosphate epimerase
LSVSPLVASVQTSAGSPLDHPDVLAAVAVASQAQGVRIFRMQGVANITRARAATGPPIIGLIKRDYADSEVYITPTAQEVDELLQTGCEVIALDGTPRPRPGDQRLSDLIARAHQAGKLVLADIDRPECARFAEEAGADLLSTTLGGYTKESRATEGPDLDLLRDVLAGASIPVLAEGRFEEPWQVDAALRIGAAGVVIGGALNDPEKNTRRFMPHKHPSGKIGAVDIGGTWLRFGTFSSNWELLDSIRILNPPDRRDRLDWIRSNVRSAGIERLGVSTGGIVDPATGEVWTAKEYLMPDHVGIVFDETTLGVPTRAHGDGHATAWGHACLPPFAGKRVVTLALGTGVGCGFVQNGKIWCGRRGEYPRVNDLPTASGVTYEDLLGGIHLTALPTHEAKGRAEQALRSAVKAVRDFYFPDELVIAGSVGLSEWLAPTLAELGAARSPFGPDAGLYGAAALALYPASRSA